jgi:hypothetical protein
MGTVSPPIDRRNPRKSAPFCCTDLLHTRLPLFNLRDAASRVWDRAAIRRRRISRRIGTQVRVGGFPDAAVPETMSCCCSSASAGDAYRLRKVLVSRCVLWLKRFHTEVLRRGFPDRRVFDGYQGISSQAGWDMCSTGPREPPALSTEYWSLSTFGCLYS